MTPVIQTTLLIAAISIVGIFVFMTVFYLLILALDKIFPYLKERDLTDEPFE